MKYGFLEFINSESSTNFYTNYNNRTIPNTTKQFKLNWATYGTTKTANMSHKNSSSSSQMQVYVAELDYSVTEHKLMQLFKLRYPSVCNAKIITDNNTKISKGYGFVKFNNGD